VTFHSPRPKRAPANRRAFLRGMGGVTLALPFLEGLPERSAWAAGQEPVFSLFVMSSGGVVPKRFFPTEIGALTAASLAEGDKATSALAAHAKNLLFLKNVGWPTGGPTGEPHAEGPCQALTARTPTGSGSTAVASGPSADWVIANAVHPGKAPLTLYAGNPKNGYIAERFSFSEAGKVAPAVDNPYLLYQELVGIAAPGGTMMPGGEEAAKLLIQSRNSIHDLVREELQALLANSRLSAADRQRLELHFDGIRDAEVKMDDMGDDLLAACTLDGLDLTKLEALSAYKYDKSGAAVAQIAELHLSLVALAFACNHRRTATLQWGDGVDHVVYDVPSNQPLGMWPFNFLSHRAQSDALVGDQPLAEAAHAEVDALRMTTLANGLDAFAERGLAEHAFVMWTNHYADGPSHSFRNVPHIIWGSGGGYLKQGEYIDVGAMTNQRLLNTLISAAIQDTGITITDFGEGAGGLLEAILA
jgi:hypothetical protein